MPTIAYSFLERSPPPIKSNPAPIQVVNKDCLEFAYTLHLQDAHDDICVLNMANQFWVGGDYLSFSAKAQEESLIHRTNLLESLVTLSGVEKGNQSNPFKYNLSNRITYTNAHQSGGMGELTCLYSPGIDVKRLDLGVDEDTLLEAPFKVNVISSAAYNLAFCEHAPMEEAYLIGTLLKIINQLRVAKNHGQRRLVLGAFGCGAFHNAPETIAKLYRAAINEYEFLGCFDQIYFAVLAKPRALSSGQMVCNFEMFSSVFTSSVSPVVNDFLKTDIDLSIHLKEKANALRAIETNDALNYELLRLLRVGVSNCNSNHSTRRKALSNLIDIIEKKPEMSAIVLHIIVVKEYLWPYYCAKVQTMFVPTQSVIESQLTRLKERCQFPLIEGVPTAQFNRVKLILENNILPSIHLLFANCKEDALQEKRVGYLIYLALYNEQEKLDHALQHSFDATAKAEARRNVSIFLRLINTMCYDAEKMKSKLLFRKGADACGEIVSKAKVGLFARNYIDASLRIYYPSCYNRDLIEYFLLKIKPTSTANSGSYDDVNRRINHTLT